MKLLVIGREGQVARSLAAATLPDGVSLLARGRPDVDLASPSTITVAIDESAPDVVINTAAYTAVDKAESEEDAAFLINATGALRLAEACAARDLPLIHLSTDYVFDGSKSSPHCEDDPVAPLGVYGTSKFEGERAVASAHEAHLILRTSWVYSPYGQNFVRTMLRLAQSRSQIGVVNDQRGSPTYAPHLAKAIISIASSLGRGQNRQAPWGIYHLSGSGEATWHDVACEIFLQSHRLGGPQPDVHPITTSEYPTPARRPANSRLNCAKIKQAFGTALPDWRTGVAECVGELFRASSASNPTGVSQD